MSNQYKKTPLKHFNHFPADQELQIFCQQYNLDHRIALVERNFQSIVVWLVQQTCILLLSLQNDFKLPVSRRDSCNIHVYDKETIHKLLAMRKDSSYLPFFSNGHPADCPAKAASLQYHPQLSTTESYAEIG